MDVSNPELMQKQERLRLFLEKLSQDASLSPCHDSASALSWEELLIYTGYDSRNGTVDVAELVSLTLGKLGIDADMKAMMEYILSGGTVGEFMNAAWHRPESTGGNARDQACDEG